MKEVNETEQTKILFLNRHFPSAAAACSLSLKGKSLPCTLFQFLKFLVIYLIFASHSAKFQTEMKPVPNYSVCLQILGELPLIQQQWEAAANTPWAFVHKGP